MNNYLAALALTAVAAAPFPDISGMKELAFHEEPCMRMASTQHPKLTNMTCQPQPDMFAFSFSRGLISHSMNNPVVKKTQQTIDNCNTLKSGMGYSFFNESICYNGMDMTHPSGVTPTKGACMLGMTKTFIPAFDAQQAENFTMTGHIDFGGVANAEVWERRKNITTPLQDIVGHVIWYIDAPNKRALRFHHNQTSHFPKSGNWFTLVNQYTYSNFSDVSDADFDFDGGKHEPCVDMAWKNATSMANFIGPALEYSRLAYDETAAADAALDPRLGTKMFLNSNPAAAALAAPSEPEIPGSFDAADQWPACPSIAKIQNQGACGSCWAFGAVETLEDRLCIAKGVKQSLSPEWIVDCSAEDMGCSGGFTDNAWRFLVNTGVPASACDPYEHCADPEFPNCTAPGGTLPTPGQGRGVCPSTCSDKSAPKMFKAATSYPVAAPGDVVGMQRELMANGPFEVSFFVYGDFMKYKGGVYRRSEFAAMKGGHAVKIVGWGSENGVDYWKVANSWSAEWGENGFFRIVRGENHCGIETMPAAGEV